MHFATRHQISLSCGRRNDFLLVPSTTTLKADHSIRKMMWANLDFRHLHPLEDKPTLLTRIFLYLRDQQRPLVV